MKTTILQTSNIFAGGRLKLVEVLGVYKIIEESKRGKDKEIVQMESKRMATTLFGKMANELGRDIWTIHN